MPILEAIADMNPDAMETFTRRAWGDVDLGSEGPHWPPGLHDRRI